MGVEANPQPHFKLLASNAVPTDLSGTVVILGEKALAISPGAAGDSLVPLTLADLSPGEAIQLGGRVTRPLEKVGDVAFVCNPVDGIVCIEAGPKIRWKTPLAYGELAGPPTMIEKDWLFTGINGAIWRVAGDSGKEIARFQLGQPLVASTFAWGDRFVLLGKNSVVHLIEKSKLQPAVE